MRTLLHSALLCVILVLKHNRCFCFVPSWDKTVTWIPEIPPLKNDPLVIVTDPHVMEIYGCIYCYKNSPDFDYTSPGLHVAVFNLNGSLWNFNIYKTDESSSEVEDRRFKKFLEGIPSGKVLAVALQGDIGVGDRHLIYTAVESSGGLRSSLLRNVKGKEAYAFLTITGQSDVTQERHVSNPYNMSYVETEYLHIETGGLRFSVNSKVHKWESSKKGLDFVVITGQEAHPILQLNANVSALRPGEKILITPNDFDWTKAEEKIIKECWSCEINEIRLSEPLSSMQIPFGSSSSAEAPVLDKDNSYSQTDNIYIKGYIKEVWTWSTLPSLRGEDEIRNNHNAPNYLYIGDCGHKGRCVITKVNILKNSYVLYYHGRRLKDVDDQADPAYLFHLTGNNNDTLWIDGGGEDGSYGRLMNDNHIDPNLESIILYVDGELHIGFYAARRIMAGEELMFDYGGDAEYHFWRSPESSEKTLSIPNLNAKDQIRKKVIAPDYLYVKDTGSKARGIFTSVYIPEDSYVLYYHGRRFAEKPNNDDETYIFKVHWEETVMWIDASKDDGSFGRLLNDDHEDPNIFTVIEYQDGPQVCFYAIRDIMAGEELRYDYGGNPKGYFWREMKSNLLPMTLSYPKVSYMPKTTIGLRQLEHKDCIGNGS